MSEDRTARPTATPTPAGPPAGYRFSQRFARVSMLILIAAGTLIYFTLSAAFVRPMRDLTVAIERFRDKPEDVTIAFRRSRRSDWRFNGQR